MTAFSFLGIVAAFSLIVLAAVCWCAEHDFHPLRKAFRRFRGLPKLVQFFLVCFVFFYVVYGATKGDGDNTNAPPSMMSAPRRFLQVIRQAITTNDVERGYRISEGTDGGAIIPMPAGAVTNEHLRRRGGFDWAFRVAPDDWRFPYRDGFIDGVTVLARGEVRPDVGTLYFPVPITNGVSLLPEARWNLLPDGETSVFSHAVTDEDSLLLDWRNALVGRNPNSPTNLQMELFADGSFVWRTDGGSRFYLPVFPFDWDNDGLENSVDPEPLVPNSVDAHGTNPEWYGIVCSNVFTTTGTTGVSPVDEGLVQFKEGVNTNAYYFAEVVAANGPAPIYFVADRDSRLGSPVVVAHGGVTNRVPLLIGVEYAVTSTVPISVSVPDAMYATVISNNEHSATVKWPLEFEFNEHVGESSRTCTIDIVPFDPGGAFSWENASQHEGPSLMSALPNDGCHCVSYLGRTVVFACTSTCECGGGCKASGSYAYEGALVPVSGGECRCGFDDPPDDPHPIPGDDPVFFISFSNDAVIYEDAYQDSPGVWGRRRSTRARLTIVALPGSRGGTLTLSTSNLGKLRPIDCGPVSLPPSLTMDPEDSFIQSYLFEAEEESVSANDVVVSGNYQENGADAPITNSVALTVVKVSFEAQYQASDNTLLNRHTLGMCEKLKCVSSPMLSALQWQTSGSAYLDPESAQTYCICPENVSSNFLTARLGTTRYVPLLSAIAPHHVECSACGFLPARQGMGIGMALRLHLSPYTVSFEGIQIQEVPAIYGQESGWGTHTGYFDDIGYSTRWYHYTTWGAGVWRNVRRENQIGDHDESSMFEWLQPWSEGTMSWRIPIAWRNKGSQNGAGRISPDVWSTWTMSDSAVVKRKYEIDLVLTDGGAVFLDGERQ